MNKNKWTNIKVVYDKLLRDPLFIGINYEAIIDYFIDFIDIVGCPNLFVNKIITDVEFTDYRTTLPEGFIDVIQLSIDKRMARNNQDTYAEFNKDIATTLDEPLLRNVIETTYKISGDYIYFPMPTGTLTMVYNSIRVNEDIEDEDYGYPMIPDDPVFILALQSYIEVQWIRMLMRAGKVPGNVLDEAKQTYAWNVGRYETHSKKLNLNEMESISKMFRSIQQKNNEFSTRFKNLGLR